MVRNHVIWMSVGLFVVSGYPTDATVVSKNPKLLLKPATPQTLQTATDVRRWVETQGEEIARKLSKKRPEFSARVLLPKYAQIEREPAAYSIQLSDGSTEEKELFLVKIPVVEEGTAWIVRHGFVVVGYKRLVTEKRDEDVQRTVEHVDGKRMIRISEHSSTSSRQRDVHVNERIQPGDEPVFAPMIELFVDKKGRVYYY